MNKFISVQNGKKSLKVAYWHIVLDCSSFQTKTKAWRMGKWFLDITGRPTGDVWCGNIKDLYRNALSYALIGSTLTSWFCDWI